MNDELQIIKTANMKLAKFREEIRKALYPFYKSNPGDTNDRIINEVRRAVMHVEDHQDIINDLENEIKDYKERIDGYEDEIIGLNDRIRKLEGLR